MTNRKLSIGCVLIVGGALTNCGGVVERQGDGPMNQAGSTGLIGSIEGGPLNGTGGQIGIGTCCPGTSGFVGSVPMQAGAPNIDGAIGDSGAGGDGDVGANFAGSDDGAMGVGGHGAIGVGGHGAIGAGGPGNWGGEGGAGGEGDWEVAGAVGTRPK